MDPDLMQLSQAIMILLKLMLLILDEKDVIK